jgi:hypothetical protein
LRSAEGTIHGRTDGGIGPPGTALEGQSSLWHKTFIVHVAGKPDDARTEEGVEWEAEPYTLDELKPYIYLVFLILVIFTVIALAHNVLDLYGTKEVVPKDVHTTGTVDLRGGTVEPYAPYGPHVFVTNFSMRPGDMLRLEYTASGPPEGVEVFLQSPLSPTNSTTMPARVFGSASGLRGNLTFVATEAGAYQVYIIHPAAVRQPPLGVDNGDWHVDARVDYTLTIQRARD